MNIYDLYSLPVFLDTPFYIGVFLFLLVSFLTLSLPDKFGRGADTAPMAEKDNPKDNGTWISPPAILFFFFEFLCLWRDSAPTLYGSNPLIPMVLLILAQVSVFAYTLPIICNTVNDSFASSFKKIAKGMLGSYPIAVFMAQLAFILMR